ncbi:GDSL-type esterase/lipase family protein [Streptomyces niveus]|uniref:GDSL-type esterase/lipase family protein n=1 Tax=Streptomyces niveus TaxID=193462 RepID=UPI00341FEB21
MTKPIGPRHYAAHPGGRPVLVCAGDSITQGRISADWVRRVATAVAPTMDTVNAGISGDLAWNLLARLDAVIACQPAIVTVLIGTNDMAAQISAQWSDGCLKSKGLPQRPTPEWYRENLHRIVERLKSETSAGIALMSLPPIGDTTGGQWGELVAPYNAIIHEVATQAAVPVLPVHEQIAGLITPDKPSAQWDGTKKLMGAATARRFLLRQTWSAIARRHGFTTTTDGVHLTELAATQIALLVEQFVAASTRTECGQPRSEPQPQPAPPSHSGNRPAQESPEMTTSSPSPQDAPTPDRPPALDLTELAARAGGRTPREFTRLLERTPGALSRGLAPGQTCRLHVFEVASRSDVIVAEFDDVLFEAPNWGDKGETLYLNGNGGLWEFPLDSCGKPRRIAHEGLPHINNDHVLDPGGASIFMSAMDGQIYHGSLNGGRVRRVTDDDDAWHFLHGVSPDGKTLGFVRIDASGSPSRLALISSQGGPVTVQDTGAGAIDGPEWSPDGEWIYFNTERWASRPGHAQLARVPSAQPFPDKVERLASTDTVDWFPHLSPDGRLAAYLQFPVGTEGHPANLPVEIVLADVSDWTTPLARVPLFGGQGTINVNSWSPDSTRFAFVSYPLAPTPRPAGSDERRIR